MHFRIASYHLFISNLIGITLCYFIDDGCIVKTGNKIIDDCFIEVYRKLKADCSNSFNPNGTKDMQDFFRTKVDCSESFETVGIEDTTEYDTFSIKAFIKHHYATVYVRKMKKNLEQHEIDVVFSILLPRTAMVSNFIIEIDGKLHKAQVIKRIDNPSTNGGINQFNFRKFSMSTKLKPNSMVNFHLIYEELLERKNGKYELPLNINPGQIVDNLQTEVYINENQPLVSINIPLLKRPTDTQETNPKLDANAVVIRNNPNSALINFQPNPGKQTELAELLGRSKQDGLDAIFTVQYDIQWEESGGIVLTDGCHFVHFFAADHLEVIPKYVVFVLDTSSSMGDDRMSQLKKAMQEILPQLKPDDLFSVVQFSTDIYIDDIGNRKGFQRYLQNINFQDYPHFHEHFKNEDLPRAVPANSRNIRQAISDINKFTGQGGTNLIGGLMMAILLMKRAQQYLTTRYEYLTVLITDGEPTMGESSHDKILKWVTDYNFNTSSIFSLGLGTDTNYAFLKKLAALNRGNDKYIADIDASIQLKGYFDQISHPVLSNIVFDYDQLKLKHVTDTNFPMYFKGSELIVAGKMNNMNISPKVSGWGTDEYKHFIPQFGYTKDPLDRLWAHLTIKQSFDKMITKKPTEKLIQKTMNLAIKYSFVTPLTSLTIKTPDGKLVYDNSIIKPAYKPPISLNSMPVNVMKIEVRQPKCPIELLSNSTTIWFDKIPPAIKSSFINQLPKLLGKLSI